MNASVQRGHKYRAVFHVTGFKAAFASCGAVLDRLVDAGFDRVSVKALGGARYEAEGAWLHPDSDADVDYLESLTDLGPA